MEEILIEEQQDVATLFAGSTIGRGLLDDPAATVNGLQELRFQRVFADLTAQLPHVWIQAGRRYRMLHYGVGGLVAMTAANLNEMARTLSTWSHLTYSLSHPEVIESDGIAIGLEFNMTEVPESLRMFTMFRDLGAIVTLVEDLTLRPVIERAELTYRKPAWTMPEGLLPNLSIRFGAPRSGVFWSRERALEPLLHADPVLHRSFLEQSKRMAPNALDDDSLLNRVSKFFEQKTEDPRIDEVADRLHMSIRTLQRRLEDHRVTFHSLRANIRASQAKSLLDNSDLSISEIAWRTGFADSTAFSHAFRRWTSISPRHYRQRRH